MEMNDAILIQGDCLELMKDIPDGSVDLVVTDPPYGIDFVSNFRKEKYKPMGSGSTGIACVNTGRKFIGMELEEKLFEIAQKRIEEAKKAVPV